MFWARVRRFTRTLGFRLNLWYGGLFVAGALILFCLVFYLLRSALDRKDRETIETRLGICASIYKMHGLDTLREWLSVAHEARERKAYFLRVDDRAGRLLLFLMPEHWDETDERLLSLGEPVQAPSWRRIPRDELFDLSVASRRLPDGATIQVARRTLSAGTLLHNYRRIFAAVLAPTILLGFVIGALVARRLTAPLRQLARAVREIIDTRKMEVRVPMRRANDELRDLIVLFNRMIEQNHGCLRTMKETLDNVAHDVRTPLTRLRGIAESTLHHPELSSKCAAPLEECLAETDRIQTIVQTLLEVARAEGGVSDLKLERVDVASVVEDAVELYEHVAEEKRIRLDFTPQRGCYARIDVVRMRRVFANLLDNAVLYTAATGSIHVDVRPERDEVIVRIRDTGLGISEEDLPRIWERLFRCDKSRAECGLGLGLSLVKAIVEANGGRVGVKSSLGKGSEFIVSLPAASRNSAGDGGRSGSSETRALVVSGKTAKH
ncbi:MAG: HAMP domain-containing histidine kinase [Verrucomicrobiota bacterium]|nr:HAMP domain-containing histidine kinase [Verrucomicrobiota bacterium]